MDDLWHRSRYGYFDCLRLGVKAPRSHRNSARIDVWAAKLRVPDDYGVQMRRTNQRDGTVPRMSAESLFPHKLGEQDRQPSSFVWEDDESLRQYPVIGVEHEPAYKNADVQTLVLYMIDYFLKNDVYHLKHG